MSFIDQARVYIRAGNGGNGIVGFRKEKFIEFGGPDGGDGGDGGDVIFEVDSSINTLTHFQTTSKIIARSGQNGSGQNRTGASGDDVIVKVPKGTRVLTDEETIIVDLNEDNRRFVMAKGGKGGLGNARFKSSVNRAPRKCTPGTEGEEIWVKLSLMLISNVGLVGMPNAGKSTFLSSVTAARPKIASYPFTTLHPNLGVASVGHEEIVIADIPGLIEGASQGIGLGIRFLKHIERCQIILHILDIGDDIVGNYNKIRKELTQYSEALANKREVIALNKVDVADDKCHELSEAFRKAIGKDVYLCSGVTKKGVNELLFVLLKEIKAQVPEQM